MNIWQSHIDDDIANFILISTIVRIGSIGNDNYFRIYTDITNNNYVNFTYNTIKECRMKRLELVQMWRNAHETN